MDTNVSSNTNSYSNAALRYIETIRQHSFQAANCLELLLADYGTRVAYLVAFALVDLKKRQLESHYTPTQRDLYAFTFCDEMGNTPAAMRLYKQAVANLFPGDLQIEG